MFTRVNSICTSLLSISFSDSHCCFFPAVSSPCSADLSTLHGRDGLGEQQQGERESLVWGLELDDL